MRKKDVKDGVTVTRESSGCVPEAVRGGEFSKKS